MQDEVQKKIISTNFDIFINGLANILQSRLIINFNYNLVHDLSYTYSYLSSYFNFLVYSNSHKKNFSLKVSCDLKFTRNCQGLSICPSKANPCAKKKNFSIAESEYLWIWGHLSSHTLKSKLRSLIGRSTNLTLNSLKYLEC